MKSEARKALPSTSLIVELRKAREALNRHFDKDEGVLPKTTKDLERHLEKQERALGVSVPARGTKPKKEKNDVQRADTEPPASE